MIGPLITQPSELTPGEVTDHSSYELGVIAERERCAKIADAKNAERNCGICDEAGEIAAEIRSGK